MVKAVGAFLFWPVQMFVEKVERSLAVDAVAALEEFDLGAVGYAELGVEPSHFGVLVRHPSVAADEVKVAAFDHERPRRH